MSGGLRGFDVETTELPIAADLLEDQRDGEGAFRAAGCVENDNCLFARRKTAQGEDGAVFGLSTAAENAAEEFSAG